MHALVCLHVQRCVIQQMCYLKGVLFQKCVIQKVCYSKGVLYQKVCYYFKGVLH